jgi:hypothetical protein
MGAFSLGLLDSLTLAPLSDGGAIATDSGAIFLLPDTVKDRLAFWTAHNSVERFLVEEEKEGE